MLKVLRDGCTVSQTTRQRKGVNDLALFLESLMDSFFVLITCFNLNNSRKHVCFIDNLRGTYFETYFLIPWFYSLSVQNIVFIETLSSYQNNWNM